MKTYAIYNLKGGVGKTTSCINLAYLAAKEGYSTLIWDIDPQGAATYLLGHERTNKYDKLKQVFNKDTHALDLVHKTQYKNLYLLPCDSQLGRLELLLADLKKSKQRMKKSLSPLRQNFDYVFIDCPPNLNLVAENIFHSSDFILTPLTPSRLAENAYVQVFEFMKAYGYDNRKLIPFFTLVDVKKKLHQEIIQHFKNNKRKILNTFIPYSVTLEQMTKKQAPVHHYSPSSIAAAAYRNLWQELKWFKKFKPVFS